eukprot:TRINITY_DN1375_c0_g1_i2.p1 TRINITY_DN1375_c0_g1~~TRINITY_DN1375_c0_g1_i2.p1  ORF type:complete len:143 (+),score=3.38 TRINITY_DN1375_c0_g1_i2:223-651(+)
MFFQWILCVAIFWAGWIVQLVRHEPPFEPIAMIGGVLWAHGNLMVVPIVKTLGLSLGLLIWGMVSLILGWATSNFGLFGLKQRSVERPYLNYIGFGLAVCSVAIYAFVKPTVEYTSTPPPLFLPFLPFLPFQLFRTCGCLFT